jgi:hypothetical protein
MFKYNCGINYFEDYIKNIKDFYELKNIIKTLTQYKIRKDFFYNLIS